MPPSYTLGSAPGSRPLVGHALRLLNDPCRFLASLPAHGDLVRIRLGPHQAIAVCHPELAHQILSDDRTFDKGGPLIDRGRELFGDNLVTCVHDRHRRQRRLVQPAFHKARLPAYASVMTERVGALTASWNEGDTVDVLAEIRTLVSGVAATYLFAASMTEADQQQALTDLSILLAGTFQRMFLPPVLARFPFPGNRSYERACVSFRRVLGQLITDYRRSGIDHGDALSMLLAARDDGTPLLTEAEITDEVVSLFVGGSDTTAITLSWALHLLARHPDTERQLHAEIDAVLSGRPATFNDIEHLPFTSNVITETLRLYPPLAMVTRAVTADTELGGYPMAAGSTIVFSPMTVHHRPDLFADPWRFNPERWADLHVSPPQRGTFAPFGGGARKCIGDNLGMTMAVLALASIAARWKLAPLPDARVRPVLRTLLAPRGLRMTVTSRQARHGATPLRSAAQVVT